MYLTHLRLMHAKHYTGCSVQCGQDGCPRVFDTFRALKRHLERCHANSCSDANVENNSENLFDESMDTDEIGEVSMNEVCEEKPNCITLTASFMRLLGQLECKANIAHANIQAVVENMRGFVEDIACYCTDKINDLVMDLNIDLHTNVVQRCMADIQAMPILLDSISTDNKRLKFLSENAC